MKHLLKSLCELHVKSALYDGGELNENLIDKYKISVTNMCISVSFYRERGSVTYIIRSGNTRRSMGILSSLQEYEFNLEGLDKAEYLCHYNCALKDLLNCRRSGDIGW